MPEEQRRRSDNLLRLPPRVLDAGGGVMERLTLHTLMSVDYIVRWIDKFGKTVFLTREEAEKALEAMKDD